MPLFPLGSITKLAVLVSMPTSLVPFPAAVGLTIVSVGGGWRTDRLLPREGIMRKLLLFGLVVGSVACTSKAPTAPAPPAPSTFTLSGTITSGGTPIATATIAIIDGPNALKVVTTGANGLYQFAGLQPGGFTAVIGAVGYQTTTRAVTLTADTVLNVELVR